MDRRALTSRPKRAADSGSTPSYTIIYKYISFYMIKKVEKNSTSTFWQRRWRIPGRVRKESVGGSSTLVLCWKMSELFGCSLILVSSLSISSCSMKVKDCFTVVVAPDPSWEKGRTTCFSSQSIWVIRWAAIVCWQELVELTRGTVS